MNSTFDACVKLGMKVIAGTLKAQAPAIRNTAVATIGKLAGEMIRESVPKGAWAESARVLITAIAHSTKVDVAFPREEVPVAEGETVK